MKGLIAICVACLLSTSAFAGQGFDSIINEINSVEHVLKVNKETKEVKPDKSDEVTVCDGKTCHKVPRALLKHNDIYTDANGYTRQADRSGNDYYKNPQGEWVRMDNGDIPPSVKNGAIASKNPVTGVPSFAQPQSTCPTCPGYVYPATQYCPTCPKR